ncbi:hypothetical protein FRC06_010208 [Ceratobasidium sp. 370]|nr:hypothetical protein FRC06_010208 [Ceratobasidium sp. 370]
MRTQHALHTLQAFPVYSLGFITDEKLLIGGGGGATRSGIKNKLRLYEVDGAGAKFDLTTELELERDEDAPMSMAVDHQGSTVICGINGSMEKMEEGINPHCRTFSIEMKEETKPLIKFERSTQLVKDKNPEAFQKVTALSKDGTIIAAGSSDGKPFNQVTLVAYPKLDRASEAFTIPSGELFDADFSLDGYFPSDALVTY